MMFWDELLAVKRQRMASSMNRTKNDYRSAFKKDFDTICNSSTLRRLQDKAQIFPLEEEDYARTRLTHSVEVLSVAESLGIALQRVIMMKKNEGYLQRKQNEQTHVRRRINDIPVILMAAALLHDMGNPPFGHLGEQIINDWFESKLDHIEFSAEHDAYEYVDLSRNSLKKELEGRFYEDLIHFDGNAQLLRLVSKLSLVVDDYGMNLTYPVMASFIKYPCSSETINEDNLFQKKAGYFVSEEPLFEDIAKTLGLVDDNYVHRHPLAFLVEAADDIAYLTADIEDAHHKGIISINDINEYLEVFAEKDAIAEKIRRKMGDFNKEALAMKVPKRDDYIMHRLRVMIKGEMINAVSDVIESEYEHIMEGKCNEELLKLSSASSVMNAIRELERDKVYYCRNITESKTKAAVIIRKLLDVYVLAALNYKPSKDKGNDTETNFFYESISLNYRYVCDKSNKNCDESTEKYNKLRLVIDQIAGMTDSRALSIYRVLTATK